MVFDGLKPISAKILALGMAFLFILFGTTWLSDFQLDSVAKALIMVVIAIVLGVELGLKFYTKLSSLRKLGIQQYLSLAIVGILIVGAVLTLANIDPGQSINSITNFFIGIGSIFIAIEAFN